MKSPLASTVKRLFSVSGNQCAFPACDAPLVDEASGKVTGQVCHIRARKPGGPRYDPNLSAGELHAFENLLLLCPTHHTVIDRDPAAYPTERVLAMKADHEARCKGGPPPGEHLSEAFLSSLSLTVVVNVSPTPAVRSGRARPEASGGSRLGRRLRRLLGGDDRETYERHGRLIELRRPPTPMLETLRRAGVRSLSVRAKRYALAAVFYYLWFGFDVWFVSKVGLDYSSALDMLPPPAFLALGSGFTYLAWLNRRQVGRMKIQSLTFGGDIHLTRELTLEADFERLAVECVSALRATGALIFEIARSSDDQVTISAFREHGGRWTRFTARGFAFDEIVVSVLREEGRCLVRVETSLGRDPGRSVGYVSGFLKRLVGWGRK